MNDANFYPINCVTLRNTDLYCNIIIDSNDSKVNRNNIIIETKDIFNKGRIYCLPFSSFPLILKCEI